MHLSEAQYYLNRLYTEKAFRQQFFSNRDAFFRANTGMDVETLALLQGLKEEQVEFFAASLLAKRLQALSGLLPGLSGVLNRQELEAHFLAFSTTYVPQGIHKHHHDALHFCQYLQPLVKDRKALARILQFESRRLSVFLRRKPFAVSFYWYDPFLLQAQAGSLRLSPALIAWKGGGTWKVWRMVNFGW